MVRTIFMVDILYFYVVKNLWTGTLSFWSFNHTTIIVSHNQSVIAYDCGSTSEVDYMTPVAYFRNTRFYIELLSRRRKLEFSITELTVHLHVLRVCHHHYGSKEEIQRWGKMFLRTQTRILPDHCCRYWNIASNGRAKSLKHFLDTAMAKKKKRKKKTLSNFCWFNNFG